MDAIKAELARKKAAKAAAKAAGAPKYRTKAEIEAEERAKQQTSEANALVHANATPPTTETSGKSPQKLASSNTSASNINMTVEEEAIYSDDDDWDVEPPISTELVKKNLRLHNEPITLFGESPMARYRRYRSVVEKNETVRANQDRADRFGATLKKLKSGDQDDHKDAISKAMEDLLEASRRRKKRKRGDDGGDDTNAPSVAEEEAEEEKMPLKELVESESISKHAVVLRVLKRYMRRWEEQLHARTADERRKMAGKVATASFIQSAENLKPLFKALRKEKLAHDILKHVHAIVVYLVRGQYVKAHDSYLMLAIGNAAWPMGVTSVGIHERKGRSNIAEDKVAHVLNNETQRKYIQSIKRIITFVQNSSEADPSQMVR